MMIEVLVAEVATPALQDRVFKVDVLLVVPDGDDVVTTLMLVVVPLRSIRLDRADDRTLLIEDFLELRYGKVVTLLDAKAVLSGCYDDMGWQGAVPLVGIHHGDKLLLFFGSDAIVLKNGTKSRIPAAKGFGLPHTLKRHLDAVKNLILLHDHPDCEGNHHTRM